MYVRSMVDIEAAQRVGEVVLGRTVATAESCTAGLVSQSLAAAEGSLVWLRGGLVAYQPTVKRELLGVGPEPVVTEQAAREMAVGAARLFEADAAVSVTGVAGPDPHDGVEPGTVIIGVALGADVETVVHHFDGDASSVCEQAARAALDHLASRLAAER
jgi:nicotinamide-nucleotide amidase